MQCLKWFYVNIAKEIGNNNKSPDNAGSHSSIEAIKETSPPGGYINFEFKSTEQSKVLKVIQSLSSKKAAGIDQIPTKIIKTGAEVRSGPLCYIFNKSIKSYKFPDRLKQAQVSPIFKKDDPSMKKNYRPVGVLPTPSKKLERVIFDQLSDHSENIFHTLLAAFRKGFGCQTTLMRLVEDWQRELDTHGYVGPC